MASAVRTIVVDGERAVVWVVELMRSKVIKSGSVYWVQIVDVTFVGFALN